MSISTSEYTEIKLALKDALVELLQERRDLFHDLVKEVVEEAGLVNHSLPEITAHSKTYFDNNFEKEISKEIKAFHNMHAMLLEKYPSEFVAVHEEQVVDHDLEKLALYRRIQKNYPEKFVLLRHVEEEPERELHFRSTRFSVNKS